MGSLYDDLADKIARDTSLTRRSVPKADLTLLLYNSRSALHELWLAADEEVRGRVKRGSTPSTRLVSAVEELRPVFGERTK